jgi:hypothetical protein
VKKYIRKDTVKIRRIKLKILKSETQIILIDKVDDLDKIFDRIDISYINMMFVNSPDGQEADAHTINTAFTSPPPVVDLAHEILNRRMNKCGK